jgi:alcohol dehydrogenase
VRAVIYEGPGSVRVGDAPMPTLQDKMDAIVKITHSSICGSDMNILSGKISHDKGGIMGHEGAGVVYEVGPDVTMFKPGDRVVLPFSIQCGECETCRSGYVVSCERGGQLGHGKEWGGYGGTQAEYLRIPWAHANLQHIPDSLTTEQALFVGDILSTGYHASLNGSIQPGDTVAVFGAGPVGLCAVMTSRLFGPSKVITVDMLDYRLEAAIRLGADVVVNASKQDAVEAVKAATEGKGVNVAIEAVGSPATFDGCFESLRPRGTISIVGVFPFEKVGVSMRRLLRQGMTIRGGRANLVFMGRLLRLIEAGVLDPLPLITHRMKLEDALEAYRIFGTQSDNVLKIILEP